MPSVLFTIVLIGLVACRGAVEQSHPDVVIAPLENGVWLHTSYQEFPQWGRVRSNGLIVREGDFVTLVDTAWTNEQTEYLVDWIEAEWQLPVRRAVLTHAHDDKMGGVGWLNRRGVETWAHRISNRIAPSRGLEPAKNQLSLEIGQSRRLGRLRVHYPGPGHSAGNIVVAVDASSVLHGGCLIRPGGSQTLGNTADANVKYWAQAVENVATWASQQTLVVPSHGEPAGPELLAHTIALGQQQREK